MPNLNQVFGLEEGQETSQSDTTILHSEDIFGISPSSQAVDAPVVEPRPVSEDIEQGLQNLVTQLGNVPQLLPNLIRTGASLSPSGPLTGQAVAESELFQEFSKSMRDLSVNIQEWAQANFDIQPELSDLGKPAENFLDNFTPRRLAKVAAENGPTMLATIGTLIANPVAGTALIAGIEGGDISNTFNELKEAGNEINPFVEGTVPVIVGTLNAALEKVGLDRIISAAKIPGVKSKILSVILAPGTEGLTEGAQELNAVLGERAAGVEVTEESLLRVKESFIAGMSLGLVGGAASGTIGAASDFVSNRQTDPNNPVDVPEEPVVIESAQQLDKQLNGNVLNRVLEGQPKKDILGLTEWVRTPDNALSDAGFHKAAGFASDIIEGELKQSVEFTRRQQELEAITAGLGLKGKELKAAIPEIEAAYGQLKAGRTVQEIVDDKGGKIAQAAVEVDKFFKNMQSRYKDYLIGLYRQSLPDEISTAVEEAIRLDFTSLDIAEIDVVRTSKFQSENLALAFLQRRLDEGVVAFQSTDDAKKIHVRKKAISKVSLRKVRDLFGLDKIRAKTFLRHMRALERVALWNTDNFITEAESVLWRITDRKGNVVDVAFDPVEAREKVKTISQVSPGQQLFIDMNLINAEALQDVLPGDLYLKTVDKISKLGDAKAEELSKITKIPVRKKFTLPKGQVKFNATGDFFDTLISYSYNLEKRIAIEPIALAMRKEMRADDGTLFPENVTELLNNQLKAARGQYSFGDRIFDEIAARFAESSLAKATGLANVNALTRPLIYSRAVKNIRQFEGILKLGYKPMSGLINGASAFGHTWTKIGTELTVKAQKFLRTSEGKQFIQDNQHLLAMDFVSDLKGHLHTKNKRIFGVLPSPLDLFGWPEPYVRENALAASFLYVKETLGLNDSEATIFAGRANRSQTFSYNVSSLPRLLRSPSGKLFGQFKTYLVKELEFINSLNGSKEWLRYLGMQMALGGPRGILYMAKSVPFFFALGMWDNLEEWMEKNLSIEGVDLTRGIPGAFGIDISLPASIQLPHRPEDWAGPFLSDAWRMWGEVLGPTFKGEQYVFPDRMKDYIDALPFLGPWVGQPGPGPWKFVEFSKGLAPVTYYWDQLAQSVMDDDGRVLDRKGNFLYNASSWWDRAILASGAMPTEGSKRRVAQQLLNKEQQVSMQNRRGLYKDLVRHIRNGEDIPDDLIDKAVAFGITDFDPAITQLKMSQVSPSQRAVIESRLLDKARALQVFEDVAP